MQYLMGIYRGEIRGEMWLMSSLDGEEIVLLPLLCSLFVYLVARSVRLFFLASGKQKACDGWKEKNWKQFKVDEMVEW